MKLRSWGHLGLLWIVLILNTSWHSRAAFRATARHSLTSPPIGQVASSLRYPSLVAPPTAQPSARGALPPQATNLLPSLEPQVHSVASPQYYLLTLRKWKMKMLKMQKQTSVYVSFPQYLVPLWMWRSLHHWRKWDGTGLYLLQTTLCMGLLPLVGRNSAWPQSSSAPSPISAVATLS